MRQLVAGVQRVAVECPLGDHPARVVSVIIGTDEQYDESAPLDCGCQ